MLSENFFLLEIHMNLLLMLSQRLNLHPKSSNFTCNFCCLLANFHILVFFSTLDLLLLLIVILDNSRCNLFGLSDLPFPFISEIIGEP